MNERSLIFFIVGFIFVFLFSLHLGAVYFPAGGSEAQSDPATTPSSTLLSYTDLFNNRETAAIPSLVVRSKRRIGETVSIEEVLADHFIRNIRIDTIRMGSSPVFSSDGIIADIACGIQWQLSDGTFFDEERTVTMVQEEGTWRLDGIIIPPSEFSGTQPELPTVYLFQKTASV